MPNSGIQGGKFLERMRILNSSPTPVDGSIYLEEGDFFVGAHLHVFSKIFHLLESDEFTLKYMEDNCKRFPVANCDSVLGKVRVASCERCLCALILLNIH